MTAPHAQLGPDETLDRLAGGWWILQLRSGHRYSTDDVLTAWTGLQARPTASSVLDLGAGVGAVGLMSLQGLSPRARLVAVEVQAVSAGLARRSVALNRQQHRVQIRQGDLRQAGVLEDHERFDLVLANPPYLTPGTASPSPHPQRAAARLELHGDLFDYCRVAAAHLAAAGRFCLCHSARDPRPERAIAQAGFALLARHEVRFRHGRSPMIAIFTCGHDGQREDPPPLCIRGADGAWTEDWLTIRHAIRIDP